MSAKVAYFDPLIPYLNINQIDLKSISLKKEKLNKFDCVVVATDHTNVDYKHLLNTTKLIFDTRNVYKNTINSKLVKL